MCAQTRFDPCDERVDVLLVRRIVETRGERLIAKAGRAVGEIKAERKQWKRRADNQDRRLGCATIRLGATRGARAFVRGEEAPRDLDARGLGFRVADQAPRAIARNLGELIAIDCGIESLGRAGFDSRRDERTQQAEENDRRERGEHEPKDHRRTCLYWGMARLGIGKGADGSKQSGIAASAYGLPGPVRLAASRAARGLRLAADIDRVGVGPTILAPLLVGLARHDLPVILRLGIVPGRCRSRLAVFEGLIFGRGGELTVLLVETLADLIADNAADHGADSDAARPVLGAGDRRARGAAGDGADNRAGALLVARPAGRKHGR